MIRPTSTEAFVKQDRQRWEPNISTTAPGLLDSHRLIKTGCIIFLPLAITLITVATSVRYMHTPGNKALFPASSTPSSDERRLADDGAEVTHWQWRWPSGTPGGGRNDMLTTEQIETPSLIIDWKEPTLVPHFKELVAARAADEFSSAGTSVTPPKAQLAPGANHKSGQSSGDKHHAAGASAPFHLDRKRGNNDSENVQATSGASQGRGTKGRPYAPFIRTREEQPFSPHALGPSSKRATRKAERGWPSQGYVSTNRTSASSKGYRSQTAHNGSTSLRHRLRHGDAIRTAPPRLPVYTPERFFKRETTRPPVKDFRHEFQRCLLLLISDVPYDDPDFEWETTPQPPVQTRLFLPSSEDTSLNQPSRSGTQLTQPQEPVMGDPVVQQPATSSEHTQEMDYDSSVPGSEVPAPCAKHATVPAQNTPPTKKRCVLYDFGENDSPATILHLSIIKTHEGFVNRGICINAITFSGNVALKTNTRK
ncbi:hypothetical protein HPB48_000191 [Haemaphysalis longicornis]|uniref:Uncharacterized protein n=1 Tax=Haemaphysalis longicornis TaxID=44386 RepID=A0A9J6FEG8_HAELO|nr:hypothetical protein HPB48_000191 [Haemaphysalis longicornis]